MSCHGTPAQRGVKTQNVIVNSIRFEPMPYILLKKLIVFYSPAKRENTWFYQILFV
jgi:hypothetical protein